MIEKASKCVGADTLEQIAGDELTAEELMSIEAHVSDCARCRDTMDMVCRDATWNDAILPVLSESDSFGRDVAPWETGNDFDVVGLLGPTDDPRMMGRIGNYEVVGVIGRGGMGIVFKAFDTALNRNVAIKMLSPHLASSGAARARFSREGQAAAAVVDDHVLPIYGVDRWQGIPYLVMQYSSGMTLQQRIHQQGSLELNEVLRIGIQAARGLSAAHSHGLVHRDVKPSNILLSSTVERAMLTDFGLARAVDDASMTRSGMVAGTPQFMSPEQARGELVDQRSDQFSLGSCLYCMCTGLPPFRAQTSYGVMRMITDNDPRPIQERNPAIPRWLCSIVEKLMAKEPSQRFGSAHDVAMLLQDCLAHVQQPASVPLPTSLAAPPKQARLLGSPGPIRAMFAAVVCMAIILLVSFGPQIAQVLTESSDQPNEPKNAGVPILSERRNVPQPRITEVVSNVEQKEVLPSKGMALNLPAGLPFAAMEFVFFQDQARTVCPAVLLRDGDKTLAIVCSTATLVPEDTPPAIDYKFVHVGKSIFTSRYFDGNTEFSIYDVQESEVKFQRPETIEPVVGDIVSAIVAGTRNCRVADAGKVVALNAVGNVFVPQRNLIRKHSGLIQIDKLFPEGTLIMKDGKFVGVVLLGERFSKDETSLVVPANRIHQLTKTIQKTKDVVEAESSEDNHLEKSEEVTSVENRLAIRILAQTKASRPFDWKAGEKVTVGVRVKSDEHTRVIGVATNVVLVATKTHDNRVEMMLRPSEADRKKILEAAKISELWFEVMPFKKEHLGLIKKESGSPAKFLEENSGYRPAAELDWVYGNNEPAPAGNELPLRESD